MGLNTQGLKDTAATTNIAIKTAYAGLKMKADRLQPRLCGVLDDIVKVVLKEINEEHGKDYQITDIKYDFKRETMVNESENIQNEKVKAETEQLRINTLLNLVANIDDETLTRAICDELDFDYDEIKDKIAKMKDEQGLQGAKSTLNDLIPNDDVIPLTEPIIAPGA
jgi:hypothetical protein